MTLMNKEIIVRGARTHNLKNIDVSIPRDKLVVITGLSGSGKSSLAFDTLYAEGQRRYVESLSTYARQFLSMMGKPDVDLIEGLSPAISIEQKATSHNPRSTVGTITEIYDYLRLLYARVGEPHCPTHNTKLAAQTISQMVDNILALPADHKIIILAPVVKQRKGEHTKLLEQLATQGYLRVRVDGEIVLLDEMQPLTKNQHHNIEVVVDRLKIRDDIKQRLSESIATALEISDGVIEILDLDQNKELTFSAKFACGKCGFSLKELEPRMFSFNNPAGACSTCDGLGVRQFFDPDKIITDPEASIATGAIRGWDRRHFYYYQLLQCVAEHYEFSLDNTFSVLPKKITDVLFHGSGDEKIDFKYKSPRGRIVKRCHPFEGVVANMERRYKETESNSVREELAKCLSTAKCDKCCGERLNTAARNVLIDNVSLPTLCSASITDCLELLRKIKLSGQRAEIAAKILREISTRLTFLINVGLNYLMLSRSAETLSGGETQRIRLASQIGSGLTGVMYVLDEPSIGLHQRDNQRLLDTLTHLRDLGNTVIVVEHDLDAIMQSDYLIDIGPGAGVHGGEVVYAGSVKDIKNADKSITAKYLTKELCIPLPTKRRSINPGEQIHITNAHCNNLKNIDIKLPLGLFVCITGVSGSGKSSLINSTLYPMAAHVLNGAGLNQKNILAEINGLEHLDKVINIDQGPIGRTPRSNPATYTGLLTPIREYFSATTEARARGYAPGRFSFNVKGGRCEACEGDGVIKVEMHFLSDIYVKCDVCHGKRYNRETLDIEYKGKNIHDVLNMSVEEAHEFFAAIPGIKRKLQTLIDVGLPYITLGQSATTLSGGEAQRIKLSKELSKRDTGHTLYILDEPTTGLHFHDIAKLLEVLHRLRDKGNSVLVIEHNLDVIKTADWIIDIGPEGGSGGGEIVVSGTPSQVAKCQLSHTGKYLKEYI
jgi:excinuclease ABC subunit A